ncbi:MAG: MFS transporter [Barnesiella sp.]
MDGLLPAYIAFPAQYGIGCRRYFNYGGICLLGGIFVCVRVPETKGKSLEELEKELVK